jgi:hypothetical protein
MDARVDISFLNRRPGSGQWGGQKGRVEAPEGRGALRATGGGRAPACWPHRQQAEPPDGLEKRAALLHSAGLPAPAIRGRRSARTPRRRSPKGRPERAAAASSEPPRAAGSARRGGCAPGGRSERRNGRADVGEQCRTPAMGVQSASGLPPPDTRSARGGRRRLQRPR